MRIVALLRRLAFAIALFCGHFANAQTDQLPQLKYLYKPGDNGYSCFRIPAILTAKQGVILAFAEGRKNNCGDSGDIDLVLRRSTDGGKSWGPLQVVWNDSTNTCGNPVPIYDAITGKVILVSTWNLGTDHEKQIVAGISEDTRRVFVLSSDDNGISWSKPMQITADVKKDDWTWYATGPCHGVQVSKGKYKGRLTVPVNHIEKQTSQNFAHVIYSDDHGLSWHLGNNTPFDMANETTMAELSKGDLMLNIRNSGKVDNVRKVTISTDGGKTWGASITDSTLIEPRCQGSLLNYDLSPKKSVLLFSNPADVKARANLTLRLSRNDGRSWKASKVIFAGPSAYSDITINASKQVICLYEAGVIKPYEGIAYLAVDLNELLNQ